MSLCCFLMVFYSGQSSYSVRVIYIALQRFLVVSKSLEEMDYHRFNRMKLIALCLKAAVCRQCCETSVYVGIKK